MGNVSLLVQKLLLCAFNGWFKVDPVLVAADWWTGLETVKNGCCFKRSHWETLRHLLLCMHFHPSVNFTKLNRPLWQTFTTRCRIPLWLWPKYSTTILECDDDGRTSPLIVHKSWLVCTTIPPTKRHINWPLVVPRSKPSELDKVVREWRNEERIVGNENIPGNYGTRDMILNMLWCDGHAP